SRRSAWPRRTPWHGDCVPVPCVGVRLHHRAARLQSDDPTRHIRSEDRGRRHSGRSAVIELIREAAQYLEGKTLVTPVEYSPELGAWLKLEHLQRTGSFKLRGAWFRLSRIAAGERVLTCSAGNHGKGVAFAARELGVHAIVCVPSSIDSAKLKG